MKALIINADDFGFSPQINDGICDAFENGVVTDTTVLVHSPFARDAVARASQIGLPVGIHIDLVTPFVEKLGEEFGPKSLFVQELFRREYEKKIGTPFTPPQLIKIRDQIREQISLFTLISGRLPSHLDYHYGLHYLPEVMALYVSVADESAIPVRWGDQYAGKKCYSLCPGVLCDRFRGLEMGGVDLLLELLSQPWDGVMEMICHPGYFTPYHLADSYNQEREYELRVLTDPLIKTAIQEKGIQLVNYDWLKRECC